MAFAGGFTVAPQIRRRIDDSRAAAMRLFAPENFEAIDESGPAFMPLAEQAITGLIRLLEEDLCVHVRFIADRVDAGYSPLATYAPVVEDEPVGAGIGAPVRLADGRVHGMLCFFRREPGAQLDERDVRRLEMSARLAARMIDGADAHGIAS